MQIGPTPSIEGMRRAGERLERAAAAIAAPQASVARGSDPSPAPPSGDQALTAAQASGEAERAMVDMIQARRAYEANANALRQQDALKREAVSLGA